MKNKIYLKVNTDLTAILEILLWFEQINLPPLFNKESWWECQTLLIEGFTNIVEHAHKSLPTETPIEIEAERFNECIEIRLWSLGQPFDLEKKLQETSKFEENDEARGRGLKIMSVLADKLSYKCMPNNRYCLFMSKCCSYPV